MSRPTVVNKPVGSIGYGLMGLTWRADPPSVEQAFDAMKTALDQGANLWNGGEFYGTPDRHSGHLLNEYFTKYPEDADKVVLSIKGGVEKGGLAPDGSEANVRRSVEDTLKSLGGKKSIDVFECARIDPNTPVEDTISYLAKLVKEGKIGSIGLSEVKASTIERAVKIHPIAAVEVELSLWATDILRNDVAATCARLNIPIIAYSPLMRGGLAGEGIRKNADLAEHDPRKHYPKFQDDVLAENNKLTDEVKKIAEKKGVTIAQVAIAWVRALSNRTITVVSQGKEEKVKLGTIIPIPGASAAERVKENTKLVELTDEEFEETEQILKSIMITGDRYPAFAQPYSEG